MQACSNRKGQIADATEIGLPKQNSPYVCVYLRGRWQWQPIKNISGNTFKDVREQMYKNIHKCLQEKIVTEKQYGIIIGDCTTSTKDYINGKWQPVESSMVNEGEFNVYVDIMGQRYLYCVKTPVDNHMKYQWWMGVTDNMQRRKGWGFLRQKTPTTDSIPPWQVNKWLVWERPQNRWAEHAITVEKMDKEWEIKQGVDSRTKELIKQTQETIDTCNVTLNSTTELMNKHKEVSRELFNKLTKEERLAVVDSAKFRAIFKQDDLCSCCLRDAKTTKCIHLDCTGACAVCRGDDEDADCCACGKKQVMECPICQLDNFPKSFMKIFKCKHAVCYKCYSTAYELKRELKNCPLCREII